MHIFLSPHPDDAAFSCGGRIAQLARDGEHVVVYTVMGGFAPPDFRPSPFTQALHQRWGLGDTPDAVITARRREDAAAAAMLNAKIAFGAFSDCVYRMSTTDGQPLYIGEADIFGAPKADDPASVAALRDALTHALDITSASIYAPLGVGNHVDHQLTRALAFQLAHESPTRKVYFYEDVPYALGGRRIIVNALQAFAQPLLRVSYPIDEQALQAKVNASACYVSQTGSFWADHSTMEGALRDFISQNEGENYWRLLRDESSIMQG